MNNFDTLFNSLMEQTDPTENAVNNIVSTGSGVLNKLDEIQEEYFLSYFAAQVFDPTGILSYPDFRKAIQAYNTDPNSTWNQGMVFVTFLASLPGLGMGARLIKDIILSPLKLTKFGAALIGKLANVFSRSAKLQKEVLPNIFAKGFNTTDDTSKYYKSLHEAMEKRGIKVGKDDIVKAAQNNGIKTDDVFLKRISKDSNWLKKFSKGAAAAATKKGAGLIKRASRTATAGAALSGAAGKYDKDSLIDFMKNLPRGRTKQATYNGPALMGGRPGGTYIAPTR
jgi:hypothetical protein